MSFKFDSDSGVRDENWMTKKDDVTTILELSAWRV